MELLKMYKQCSILILIIPPAKHYPKMFKTLQVNFEIFITIVNVTVFEN